MDAVVQAKANLSEAWAAWRRAQTDEESADADRWIAAAQRALAEAEAEGGALELMYEDPRGQELLQRVRAFMS